MPYPGQSARLADLCLRPGPHLAERIDPGHAAKEAVTTHLDRMSEIGRAIPVDKRPICAVGHYNPSGSRNNSSTAAIK